MRRKLLHWEIAGFMFTAVAGPLLHFIYVWSEKNPAAGIFGAVNQSVWEHLKLLFWPVLLFTLAEYGRMGYRYKNFIPARAAGLLSGVLLTLTAFYTYSGILGTKIVWADVLLFFISVFVVCFVSYRISVSGRLESKTARILGWTVFGLLALGFVWFTFYPPEIPLFWSLAPGMGIL